MLSSILFQGEDIRKKGYSYHRMHHISLVFQNYNLIDYLSPLENIRLVNKKASKKILLLSLVDESQISSGILQLSGVQQQRVAIARSLVSEAPVLFALMSQQEIWILKLRDIVELLKSLAQKTGKCVSVVTHSKKVEHKRQISLMNKDKRN